ncbi:MAG: pteridine reductase [Gammaproteobacteria bacterium]|nr:pteridine reductase [Gammaproteobacteria bacterium]MDH3448007.1 pteridine reductase [Gammaproteobacteria bacterium]
MLLTDKSVLITGAASRLGAQMARTLHQNGANLIIHYRSSAAAAQALVQDLNRERTASALAMAADLADDDELVVLAEAASGAFGRLDILINNASSFFPTRFGDISRAAWDDLVASNYRAPLFLAQACYPALRKARGNIINLVDIYASRPLDQHSVYCSAKAANLMLVKSLALELAPEVRVNGIAPGAILWPESGDSKNYQQAVLESVPLRRMGDPRDIADTALFLATSDYITGEIIRVDGGRMLR